MGVGYSVSPLCRVRYLDLSEPVRSMAAGENALADLLKVKAFDMSGPTRFRSPSKEDVLTWRTRVAAKYQGLLGENLVWDEDSAFNVSEDASTRGDMLLRFAAAKLDQVGSGAARALVSNRRPMQSELDQVFAEAKHRGFAGQFPHLLLGPSYWLPFAHNLIIEEPDWSGNVARYGSAPRLADELAAIRAFISEVNPAAITWSAQRAEVPDNTLAVAWQASDTISRMCKVAVDQRLPLWTTG